jgi:hypothetical protein
MSAFNLAKRAFLASGIAAGLLAVSGAGASAAIACRGDVCWHVHMRYAYPPAAPIVVHRDYWRRPTRTVVIHEQWRPIERITREYIVRDYDGFDDLE